MALRFSSGTGRLIPTVAPSAGCPPETEALLHEIWQVSDGGISLEIVEVGDLVL